MHSSSSHDGVFESIKTALPIVSNLAMLVSISWAAKRFLVFEAMVLGNVFLWSTLYHICDGFDLCALKFGVLSMFDHFFATYVFSVLSVYAMDIRDGRVRTLLNVVLGELILVTLLSEGYQNTVLGILVAASALSVLCAWAIRGVPRYYDWMDFGASLVLTGTGLVLFTFLSSTRSTYWLYHSLWHVCVMIGAYFFLEIKNRKRSLLVLVDNGERDYAMEQGTTFPSAHMGAHLQDTRDGAPCLKQVQPKMPQQPPLSMQQPQQQPQQQQQQPWKHQPQQESQTQPAYMYFVPVVDMKKIYKGSECATETPRTSANRLVFFPL